MVLYRCVKCRKEFRKKYAYDRHCNKKKPCDVIDEQNYKNNIMFSCKHCNKEFKRAYYCERHENICKSNNNIHVHKIIELEREMKILQEKMKELQITKTSQINNTIINDNTKNIIINNNINNNIILLSLDEAKHNKLDEQNNVDIINSGSNAVVKCVELLYFNDSLPQHKCLYCPSTNSKFLYIIDQGKLRKVYSKDTIEYIFNESWCYVDVIAFRKDKKFYNKCDPNMVKEIQEHMQLLLDKYSIRDIDMDKIKQNVCKNSHQSKISKTDVDTLENKLDYTEPKPSFEYNPYLY